MPSREKKKIGMDFVYSIIVPSRFYLLFGMDFVRGGVCLRIGRCLETVYDLWTVVRVYRNGTVSCCMCLIYGQLRVCLIIGHALQDSVSKVDSEWGVVAVSHYWTGIAGQCLRTGHDPTLCPKNGQCPKMGQGGGGSEINSRFKIKSRINELTKIR